MEKGATAIPSGLPWWDSFAGPFRRGNVYIIAGYPGAGKTTLALNLAWSMAKAGRSVWYYCLELTAEETMEVLAGHITKKAEVSEADWILAYATIQATGFRFYEPVKYLPWEQHLKQIADTVRKEKMEVVFIDNLSFLTRVKSNTFEVENVASARIKALAQELNIPIILLHHLRKPENDQQEPEPTVHAMRGSGAILADASDAFILHHPVNDNDVKSRHPVGYLLSGKPRWGAGGKRYVRLAGSERTYYPEEPEKYIRRPKRVNKFYGEKGK
jgi:replicative DNA helicase